MKVSIEKQSDGTYIAYNVDSDEVVLIGTGSSVSEAKADFMDSVESIKESYTSRSEEAPAVLSEEIEFKFDLSSLFEYYSVLNVSALAKRIGINATLLRQYKMGNTYVSERQLSKIESGIHALGEELASLTLV